MTTEAAEQKLCIQTKYNGCQGKTLEAPCDSILGYSSEFRPVELLEPIFIKHLNQLRMKNTPTRRSSWSTEELSEDDQRADMDEAKAFKNYKGSVKKSEFLNNLAKKDIIHSYSLAVSLS
eukprot:8185461-Ditylum_brightwellii.AAC.1